MKIVPQTYDFFLKELSGDRKNVGNQEDRVRRRSERTGQDQSRLDPESTSAARVEDKVSLSEKDKVVRELAARDREVSAHEAAHAAVGGIYAGHPNFTYVQGPDGRRYKVGGEVSIDVAPVPNDPGKTIVKAEKIQAAALAPAEPSSADHAIAAKASRMANQARIELSTEKEDEASAEEITADDSTANFSKQNGIENYETHNRSARNDVSVRVGRIDLFG